MKKVRVISIVLLCVLLLGACGSSKEISSNVTGNEETQTEAQFEDNGKDISQSGTESVDNENDTSQTALETPPEDWAPNPISDFDYKYRDELQGLEVSYKGTSEKVWFPSEINGDPVVAIQSTQNPEVVKEVYIPEGVKVLREFAFSDCKNLSYIALPDSVTKIGSNAFYKCSSLTDIRFPSNLKVIGSTAFNNVPLTEIVLPEGLEVIEEFAFEECKELTSVVIPGSVKKIRLWAFYNCEKLAQITLADPDAIFEIGNTAFNGTYWYNMQPEGFIRLGSNLVAHKGNITESKLVIPEGTKAIAQDITRIEYIENVTEIVLPEGLKIIGEGAFMDAGMLQTVNIPESVEYIGNNAFGKCKQLDEATKERIKQLNPDAIWY